MDTWAERLIASIQAEFPALSLEQKRFYCGMTVYWNYLVYAWGQAAPAERQRMAMALLGVQPGGAAAPAVGYGTLQPQRDYHGQTGGEMSDSTYETLRNVMLEDHASTMNVLDNISDSGYDYRVVDDY